MTVPEWLWNVTHRGTPPPYYWRYSCLTILTKPIRKWFSAAFIPYIPFSDLRVWCYRKCGYKIGRNVFIGMRCYLDDTCYDLLTIEDNVVISYGVYFACHGRKQGSNRIVIKEGAYIGMRSSIVAKTDITIGSNAVVGAMTLVIKSIPDNSTAVGVPCRVVE